MNPKGFTLPELLLSTAILVFCLSSVLATFIQSSILTGLARNIAKAKTHAEYVMENIRAETFTNIPQSNAMTTWSAWSLNSDQINTLGLTALNGETVVTTVSGTNPVDVIVTVTWTDTGGRSMSHAIRTLVSG
jgi:prepilin-type N-terminal cleavage/methylation domain-containing protein